MCKKMILFIKFVELLMQAFPYLFKSMYFNFHYLPFKQAIKLPILILSKSHIEKCKGEIKIIGDVRFGMIKLGHNFHVNRPNTGFFYCNYGGTIIFRGTCQIGYAASITIGNKGVLDIGDDFLASYGMKLYSYHSIKIGTGVRCGWDCLLMDTSFHTVKMLDGTHNRGYAPIVLGSNVWLGTGCIVLPKSKLPNYCIVAAGSKIHKDYSLFPSYIMLVVEPLSIIKTGVYRDLKDDKCQY